MPSKTRVILIGLDAATFHVMKPLLGENKLPALRRLIDQGVHGVLNSTTPPITAPAWTSLTTGRNPGKHGIFDFVTRRPGTYEETLTTSRARKCEAIWNTLSKHGRCVIIANVPLTYPPEEVSGCMISGIGSPDNSPKIAFPSTLLKEMQLACGPYRVMYNLEPTDSNCRMFLADIKELARVRGTAVRYLMDRFDWDFLMVVFQSTDWVQHFLWKFMDESHPLFDHNASVCQRAAIGETYEAIDQEIGRILDKTGNRDYVFLVSDHGMGPLYKNVYFNNWLVKEGYLRYKRNLRYLAHRAGITSATAYKLLVKLRGASIIPHLRSRKEKLARFFLSMRDVDWSTTKAYSIGLDGCIRLNLKGREPRGIVMPGNEYSKLVAELKSKLQLFSDPETGERVADNVFSRDEVFAGPHTDEAPDIVLVLTRYHQDYKYGSNDIFGPPPDKISGNHRTEGVLIASGPSIKKGVKLGPHNLVDVAPTILQILGVPLPEDLDGKSMAEIFSRSSRRDTC